MVLSSHGIWILTRLKKKGGVKHGRIIIVRLKGWAVDRWRH
jgi:hypothetical protein